MTTMKTLKQRLKPEVKDRLKANKLKDPTSIRSLFIKLDKTKFVSDLKLEDVRLLHIFSDDTYSDKSAYQIMWCEHLFEDYD